MTKKCFIVQNKNKYMCLNQKLCAAIKCPSGHQNNHTLGRSRKIFKLQPYRL